MQLEILFKYRIRKKKKSSFLFFLSKAVVNNSIVCAMLQPQTETDAGNFSAHFSLDHTTSLECREFAGFRETKACILKRLKGKCSTNAKLELGTVVTWQMNGTVHNKQAERGSLNSKYPLEKRQKTVPRNSEQKLSEN